MAKIITVTFNPTIDKSTTVKGIVPEKKLRCSDPVFEPGGGGINVARAIKKLGGDAIALYPSGGHSGHFLNELLKSEGISALAVPVAHPTRENFIVVDNSNNQQYRFGMPGAELKEKEWMQCLTAIEQAQADFIVASGSIPPGVPLDIFARIAAIANKQNARFIADTSGEALLQAAQEGVYMLKPNLSELSSLVGKEEIHAELVDDVAFEIINKGKCDVLMVSLGAAGAMMVTRNEALQAIPPAVKMRSTVGAGDSMVAGAVLSLSRINDFKEALRFGVACGTAATMNSGTELCRLADVEKLLPLIRFITPK